MTITEYAIIGTNILCFIATLALSVVTAADVVKDGNRTVREAIKALVKVSLAKQAKNTSATEDERLEAAVHEVEDDLSKRRGA